MYSLLIFVNNFILNISFSFSLVQIHFHSVPKKYTFILFPFDCLPVPSPLTKNYECLALIMSCIHVWPQDNKDKLTFEMTLSKQKIMWHYHRCQRMLSNHRSNNLIFKHSRNEMIQTKHFLFFSHNLT